MVIGRKRCIFNAWREVFKFPYNGRFEINDNEMLLEKLCLYTIKVRKIVIKLMKWTIFYLEIGITMVSGAIPKGPLDNSINLYLFIRNSKAHEMISAGEEDFKYFYSIKDDKDLIFTSEFNLTSKTSINRETFTRSTNKALNLVGKSLTPAIKLTTNSLIK